MSRLRISGLRPGPASLAALLAALSALALLLAPTPGEGADRARFDTRVLALIPFPGYPARAYVHPNGRIYEGTYESDAGVGVPSRLFEYSGDGRLLGSQTIEGQSLGAPHGIQAAISDSRGRMIVLDTGPARALTINTRTSRQRTYSRFPDLPTCGFGDAAGSCSPAMMDAPPSPNYAAWGPDGSLYVTDYLQAVIWRVPPGGGEPDVWLADPRFDGAEFGTTGIMLAADRKTLLIAQGSSAGGADGNPATGKIYSVPIAADDNPGPIERLYESGPTELPDGFAIARSGNLYVPMVGTTAQIAVLDPEGNEIERFPETPFSGDNGSPVPFDSPSSAMFLGRRLIIANQSAIAGDAANQALLDVFVGERGLAPLVPAGAGIHRGSPVCVIRKPTRGGNRGAGKPQRKRGACVASFRVPPGRYSFQVRAKAGGKRAGKNRLVQRGSVRSDRRGRLRIKLTDLEVGRYGLLVRGDDVHKRRILRVRKPI